MTRTMNKWFLASVPVLMVSSLALTGCENDKLAKNDVEAIVSARLADEDHRRMAAEYAVLKGDNSALKEEVTTLKEELAMAEAKLKTSAAKATAAVTGTKSATAASKQKDMAALREKLRGGSGGK